jgi:DNA-binding response OmpR family regulator
VNTDGYVMIREEDPSIRSLLERWLGGAGYRIARAGAGPKGQCILVIANLPDPQSAEALIGALREYAAPILLVSARFRRGLSGSAETARRLGVKMVLPKPFTRTELLSAVRQSLRPA